MLLPLLEPGDAIAATGRVLPGPEVRIEVRSAGDVTRLGDLGEALPIDVAELAESGQHLPVPATSPAALPAASAGADLAGGLATSSARSGGSSPAPGGGPLAAGIGTALVLGAGWAGLVSVRRRREQRRLAARIARRLAELA
jgi:hypothetical protein